MCACRNEFLSLSLSRFNYETLTTQIIKGIIQWDLEDNVFELAQGEGTSAFSKVTMHQIVDSLGSSQGQVEERTFHLTPQALFPRQNTK